MGAFFMSSIIYLDESGDLGWNFTAPYRQGGSSRYLTIGALCVPPHKKHFPKRVVKSLYRKFNWPVTVEKKWAQMKPGERTAFAQAAQELVSDHGDIHLHGITVKKAN